MKRGASTVAVVVFVAAFIAPRAANCDQLSTGGISVNSLVQAPLVTDAKSLALDPDSTAQPGQLAIADVITYDGSRPTIIAPDGWTLIRDDSTATTRQSLYWHLVQRNDPITKPWSFSEAVDAQGTIVLLDSASQGSPIGVNSGNSGTGEVLTPQVGSAGGDQPYVLAFYATDFAGGGLNPQLPDGLTTILNQNADPREYWIGSYAPAESKSGDASCITPQLFNWVAAEVTIHPGTETASNL